MRLTKEQLVGIMPHAKIENIDRFIEPLNDTLEKFEINTPNRVACFMAQIAHESGSLRYTRELYSGEAYDVGQKAINLGNTPEDDGDGERYKGRGLIQLTGLTNYKQLSTALGVDFVGHPELLEGAVYASMSAGWFWSTRKLNALADVMNFEKITKRINGGLNGYSDRLKYLENAKKVLGI